MSIERFLAIYFPIRTKALTSNKKVMLIMAITGAGLAALNLHFFWTYEIKHERYSKYCTSVSNYSVFLKSYLPWISLAFYSLIPFLILISSSTAIIVKIIHSNYVRKHNMNTTEGAIKLTSITLTLLSVSFVLLITTGPVVVYRYVSLHYHYFAVKTYLLKM